ncbi:hypothetical protein [Jannaschia donghaensis]|uniref:Flp pilus assembly protein, pilin Flp n=1 Tax=Jannaschia donghaensis TaxID=420998 RepID=A0A0M6YEQ7_9RHOB|nr:hypothetical protein [Jannaschia donghaensis]CTQ48842.1 hypothetical protein JDO7802_00850 [Jannaschia donghaensis]
MRLNADHLRHFLRDSQGAVTVDYVVLAAAVTMVGLLSTDIIQAGMRSLAGTVDTELRGEAVGSGNGLTYSDGYDNGAQGWVGAESTEIAGIGHVLGPIENTGGGPGVSRDFAVSDATDTATFSFDLYSMDNFDGDTGTVYVNGDAVGSVTVDNGIPTFTAAEGAPPNVTVRYTDVDTNVHLGGSTSDADALSSFEIFVSRPVTIDPTTNEPVTTNIGTVNIGFGSDASAGSDNEFFAIDNFTATGLASG